VSILPDDDFSLRAALERELSDVRPDDQLAGAIIARHRTVRRRRVAGAVGLAIVIAGLGAPLGLTRAAGGPSRPGHVLFHLDPFTLRLPGQYHPAGASSASCGPGNDSGYPAPAGSPALTGSAALTGSPVAEPRAVAAAVASGACLVMLLTAPFGDGSQGSPNLPRGARPAALGPDRAWLIPHGYWRPGGATVVIERAEPGGRRQDLVITSAGLPEPALISLVRAGLS